METEAVERHQHGGGLPERVLPVVPGCRRNAVTGVEQEEEGPVGVDGRLQPGVGELEPQPAAELRLPAPGHVGRRRQQGGVDPGESGAPMPGPPLVLQRHRHPDGAAVRKRVDERRLAEPVRILDLEAARDGVTTHHLVHRIAGVERRAGRPGRRSGQQQRRAPVDHDKGAFEVDPPHRRQPLGVVGPKGEGHRDGHRGLVLHLDDDQLTEVVFGAGEGVDPLDGVAAGDPHGCLHHWRHATGQRLAHRRLPAREVPTVFGADPPVQGPAPDPRRDEPAGIDDRRPRREQIPHRRPVPVGDVGQERQLPAGDEGGRLRVELALRPERPEPVGRRRDNVAVDADAPGHPPDDEAAPVAHAEKGRARWGRYHPPRHRR